MKVGLPKPSDPETVAPKVASMLRKHTMADKRELDDLLDEFLGLLQSVLSRRALAISSFYFFGCLIFGVGFWKSCAVWLASYVPMVLPVGRKYIEQFGLLFFAFAMAAWIELLPIKEWATVARQHLQIFLQH